MRALLLALLAVSSDVSFEQTTVTATPGQETGPGVVTRVYCSGRRMRLEVGGEPGGPALILRLDEDRAYRLDPARKLAVALDAAALRTRARLDLSMAGDLMGLGAAGRAKTTPLVKPLKVAGYSCRGYRITAGAAIFDLYVTQELPIGIEAFAELLEWTGASIALGPLLDAIRALPGFPLETRSRITILGEAQETRTSVTALKLGPLPASLFEVPKDYRVVQEEAPTPVP